MTRLLALAGIAGLFLLPGTAPAQETKLIGTVGPGFTIALTDAAGAPVTQLDPGAYEIEVDDRSAEHNFHLAGPAGGGIDMSTGVDFVGKVTWKVSLTDGAFRFDCQVHPGAMRGSFNVGTSADPPPPPLPPPARPGRLNGRVGPGFTISLRTPAGRPVRTAKAGLYTVAVSDRARIHNFHLTGPGVNRKTGVPYVGKVSWRVRVRKGATYRFVCDPHRGVMRGSFRGS